MVTTTRKSAKAPRKKKATRKKKTSGKTALAQLEAELPPNLRDFSRRVRRGLVRLEGQIEREGRDVRRRAARMLKSASHELGRLEARGEREWKRQSLQARRATVRWLRGLERAIEPPKKKPRRKKKAAPARAATASG